MLSAIIFPTCVIAPTQFNVVKVFTILIRIEDILGPINSTHNGRGGGGGRGRNSFMGDKKMNGKWKRD